MTKAPPDLNIYGGTQPHEIYQGVECLWIKCGNTYLFSAVYVGQEHDYFKQLAALDEILYKVGVIPTNL
jgi:hypothetical protein